MHSSSEIFRNSHYITFCTIVFLLFLSFRGSTLYLLVHLLGFDLSATGNVLRCWVLMTGNEACRHTVEICRINGQGEVELTFR